MNYDEVINPTVRAIKPSGIRKFFDIVSDMPDAISLGVGEPDFVTPWPIRDYAIKSIQKGYTQYTANRGLPKLRREISEYLSYRFGLDYDDGDELIVTVGGSEGIDIALRTLVSPGDEVLIPDPSFVSYAPIVELSGGTPVAVRTDAAHEFKLTKEALEAAITPRSKALIVSYPNNPTGAVMDRADLEAILPIIKEHDLIVLSDEIYAELTYGAQHVSIAALDGMRERTVLVSGFSKAFAMTGWRLGYVAAPRELSAAMVKVHQYALMCAPGFSQYAGYAALSIGRQEDFRTVAEMRDTYNMRRRYVVAELNKMGLTCFEPRGAFYAFPSTAATGMDGEQFATMLLKEQKVAVVPGDAFGRMCASHVRCSYACSMKTLTEALGRMAEFVRAHTK